MIEIIDVPLGNMVQGIVDEAIFRMLSLIEEYLFNQVIEVLTSDSKNKICSSKQDDFWLISDTGSNNIQVP